ncbi:MAG: hypothetical protein HZB83_07770, partial [Deltaproteobacteria bacterium]|nr:hypothetical protein [Deltaproteobacteria bacterium]
MTKKQPGLHISMSIILKTIPPLLFSLCMGLLIHARAYADWPMFLKDNVHSSI